MGKHEPMTAKAIANRIKAKGLQKIKYYCEMCKKQCRDDNGFKCHIMSESHQRQALIVSENPDQFVNEFSKQFMDGFMYILRTRYRTKRILANTVFQEYIKERDHIHMNGTRWTSLTEFANWLGENGHVKVDESERGVLVTYIDRDPETLKRQELDVKRAQQAKDAAERSQKDIERQIEASKKIYDALEKKKSQPTPIPIIRVPLETDAGPSTSSETPNESRLQERVNPEPADELKDGDESGPQTDSAELVERPVFQVQTFALKTTTPSSYKPPPPKKKVSLKDKKFKKKSRVV